MPVLALGGCVRTQDRNARAKLSAQRLIAGRQPVRVGAPHPAVRVAAVSLVRGGSKAAVVVDLRSTAQAPLTDLPISVGVRTRSGKRIALNGGRRLDWFATHVASLAPGEPTAFVFTTSKRLPRDAKPFARVSEPSGDPRTSASQLPRLDAAVAAGRARIRNASGIPQTDLPVYAVARAGSRPVAAGTATLVHLGSDGEATVALPLVGRPGAAPVRVRALPTIFE